MGFMEQLGRGLYAAGGGDVTKFDELKQNAQQWRDKMNQQAIENQQAQQKINIEQTQSNAQLGLTAAYFHLSPQELTGAFNQAGPSAGQGMLPQAPQAPQPPPGAMMSMTSGGYGDVAGRPLPMAPTAQMLPQANTQSKLSTAMDGMGLMPSFTNGKLSLKPVPGQLPPDQAQQMGALLANGSMVPSQLAGRGIQRAQAIAEAQKIDPTFNAATADMNFAANKAGATGIEKLYNNVSTYHATFRKNADVLLNLSDKFDRNQVPLINAALLTGQQQITGNPEASRLLAAVNTVASEYARLTSSPGATGGVISDSSRHEAQSLVNAMMNKDQIRGLLDPDTGIMSIDANNRLQAIEERRNQIKGVSKDTSTITSKNINSGVTPSGIKYKVL